MSKMTHLGSAVCIAAIETMLIIAVGEGVMPNSVRGKIMLNGLGDLKIDDMPQQLAKKVHLISVAAALVWRRLLRRSGLPSWPDSGKCP
jgi:hypothetical protein